MTYKKRLKLLEILKMLLENQITTVNKISVKTKLSEKTVRTYIDNLDDILIRNEFGRIEKKPRIGIKLIANTKQRKVLSRVINDEQSKIINPINREKKILSLLLRAESSIPVSTIKIANKMYLSVPTVNKSLRKITEDILKKYNIELISIRNKGLKLIYSENNFRHLIRDLILSDNVSGYNINKKINNFLPNFSTEKIIEIIKEVENNWGIKFTDSTFFSIVVYVSLAVYRDKICSELVITENERKLISKFNEYSIANNIISKINQYTNKNIIEDEITFLALQIICSSFMDRSYHGNTNMESYIISYDKKLYYFTKEIIEIVGEVLGYNFSNDCKLLDSLIQHFASLIFRLKFGQNKENKFINLIKNNYSNIFRAVWSTSFLFEEYYNVQITESEIGYLAIYFQAAIERNNKEISALLVSNLEFSNSQLLVEKIKNYFGYIFIESIIPIHKFNKNIVDNYDIILTTDTLEDNMDRVVEIDSFLNDESVISIRNKINEIYYQSNTNGPKLPSKCYQLLDPDLIFKDIAFDNKQDLLTYIIQELEKKKLVEPHYGQTVINRENVTTTAIGNGVAIPHGNQDYIHDSKVAIGILKRPILWDEIEKVDLVFLLAVKMNSIEEREKVKSFYKSFIHLIENVEQKRKIIKMRNSIEIYKYLIS